MKINSPDNPKIKLLLKLNMAKYRKKEGLFIVEGPHLVEEARKANLLVEAFSIEEKPEYTCIDESLMRKICHTDTVVLEIGLCKMFSKREIKDKILILDGIQDPGNLGTLMRSACAFGFETLFLGIGSVDMYNDKVIRSSQGAIFKLNILSGDIRNFILGLENYTVYGTNVIQGISLNEVKKEKKIAVVLGNEGNGISEEVNSLGLKNIYIPMEQMESLNVAIAGSIIMYELK